MCRVVLERMFGEREGSMRVGGQEMKSIYRRAKFLDSFILVYCDEGRVAYWHSKDTKAGGDFAIYAAA